MCSKFNKSFSESGQSAYQETLAGTSDFNYTGKDSEKIQVDSVSENSQPHEYYLHLFGEEFLDALIAETNISPWELLSEMETYQSSRTVSIFRSESMGLIINSSMKVFWNTKTDPRSAPAFGTLFTRNRFLMLYGQFSRK